MNRYRNWVGALHWGQLLLLLPSLLCIGVAVGGGAILFTDDRDSSADFAVDNAVRELRELKADRWDALVAGGASPEEATQNVEDETRRRAAIAEADRRIASGEFSTQEQVDQFMASQGVTKRSYGDLVRAVENAQAEKERVKSRGTWVLGVGMFGWAFAWLTAFLSLWWWFGARAKPKGAQ